jgi:hypothetical protein
MDKWDKPVCTPARPTAGFGLAHLGPFGLRLCPGEAGGLPADSGESTVGYRGRSGRRPCWIRGGSYSGGWTGRGLTGAWLTTVMAIGRRGAPDLPLLDLVRRWGLDDVGRWPPTAYGHSRVSTRGVMHACTGDQHEPFKRPLRLTNGPPTLFCFQDFQSSKLWNPNQWPYVQTSSYFAGWTTWNTMSNFPFWHNFKFPQDFKLQFLEEIQIWIFLEF